ncbi:MFS transporter [Rhodococcus artemisiae]|uniref:MFS transporter n=1 Tax=Rhodococcus artemisiae TaxID=714159 RepID=A0ABU7LCK6_9NOCA|nr:MFS transporter [Rhodococcus artemisiae]MEE2059002.1 MFS transporter [Rhodococcus artemisiae]
MAHQAEANHMSPTPSTGGDEPAGKTSMARVATASLIGTVIEFYDLHIFGTAAALVFPHVFFPNLGAAAGIMMSFATLGVAFAARPLGSIIFGHFGDRLGRKKILAITMLMMGIGTFLIGVMPTAAQIGILAPLLIVALRIMQGLAAGGEWAGAVLLGAENAPPGKRGLWAVFPIVGGGIAIALANLTFLGTALLMSDEAFMNWGWRVPFLASIGLVVIGMWVRLKLEETPVFKGEVERHGTAKVPLVEAFRKQPRQLLFAAMVAMATAYVLPYIAGPYMTNYGSNTLQFDRTFILCVATVGGLTVAGGSLLGAMVSDTVGRRRVIMTAIGIGVVWSLVLFPLVDSGSKVVFAIAIPLTMFIGGVSAGPLGAFLSELFDTRYRYTAAGFTYSVGGILGGALPPLVAAAITSAFGGWVFGLLLAGLCLIGALSAYALKETVSGSLEEVTVPSAK